MYKTVIGLEVHCEVITNSKNFSTAKNSYSEYPNENIDTTDIGLPGVLPIANREAFRKSLMMALALNCQTPDIVMFDRKNYYYPDLPKGYQITQMTKPVGINGYVMINVDGVDKKVEIDNIHLEEDTASMEHFSNYSLIDYNRAGVPLLEVVTTPCMYSVKEALTFLEALKGIFLYTGVSLARVDMGQMRCDVNVNLMDSNGNYITPKVEMKNINSFNNVKLAIEAEVKRQIECLETGKEELIQETRRFDEENLTTHRMRSKADAIDYKYYIEPNIPPIKITDEWVSEIKSEIPMLQFERVNNYINNLNLNRKESELLVHDKKISDYFENVIKLGVKPKDASNWITTNVMGYLNKNGKNIDEINLSPEYLAQLIKLVDTGKISGKQSKEVFEQILVSSKSPEEIVKSLNITQITDLDTIRNIVVKLLDNYPNLIEDHKKGKNTFDFFVGQVMKETKGRANPSITARIIKEEMEDR